MKLEAIRAWNLDQPETLRDFPVGNPFRTKAGFSILKSHLLQRYQERLDSLKVWEQLRNGNVGGLDLEHLLRRIARLCRARGEVHHGIASWLAQEFTPAQLKSLYGLLSDIEERVRWRP